MSPFLSHESWPLLQEVIEPLSDTGQSAVRYAGLCLCCDVLDKHTCPGQAHLSCPLFCPCPVWEAHFEDLVQDKSRTCPGRVWLLFCPRHFWTSQKRTSETKETENTLYVRYHNFWGQIWRRFSLFRHWPIGVNPTYCIVIFDKSKGKSKFHTHKKVVPLVTYHSQVPI